MTPTDANTQAAESSPAAIEVPTEAKAYAAWRKTGELPAAAKPEKVAAEPKEESAPSKEFSDRAADKAADKPAPESEPGSKQEHKPSKAESRLNELLDDLRHAGLSPSELKTFKREMQKTEATEPAKPEQTAKPSGPEAPKKPKAEDFETWDKYEAARDQYFENLADYKANQAVSRDRAERLQAESQKAMAAKLADAKTRYGETAESTIRTAAKDIFADRAIPDAVKALLDSSTVLTDVLYVMGSQPADLLEFVELARSDPGQAIRKAVLVEKFVIEELAKGGKPSKSESGESEAPTRGEDGKFQKTPAKKVTDAPPPARELSGRGSAPPDEVDSAVKADDFARYRAAQNRREIAARKGL